MNVLYTAEELEAIKQRAFDAGWRGGMKLGTYETENAIAHLLETQADRYAPHQAADWLRAMAATIRRGECRS